MTDRLLPRPPIGMGYAWLEDAGPESRELKVLTPTLSASDVAANLAEAASIGEPYRPNDSVVVHTLEADGTHRRWRVAPIYEVTWDAEEIPGE